MRNGLTQEKIKFKSFVALPQKDVLLKGSFIRFNQ